jgi:hypothetical protein
MNVQNGFKKSINSVRTVVNLCDFCDDTLLADYEPIPRLCRGGRLGNGSAGRGRMARWFQALISKRRHF